MTVRDTVTGRVATVRSTVVREPLRDFQSLSVPVVWLADCGVIYPRSLCLVVPESVEVSDWLRDAR